MIKLIFYYSFAFTHTFLIISLGFLIKFDKTQLRFKKKKNCLINQGFLLLALAIVNLYSLSQVKGQD